jgi:hypothetical protein
MIKQFPLYYKNNRWLVISLLISIMLHLTAISQFSIIPKEHKSVNKNLTVNLISKITTSDKISRLNDVASKTTHETKDTPNLSSPTSPEINTEFTKSPVTSSSKVALKNNKIIKHQAPTNKTSSFKQSIADSTYTSEIEENEQNLNQPVENVPEMTSPTYQYVELEFDVFNGNTTSIGKSNVNFTLDANGTYILNESTSYQDTSTTQNHSISQKSVGVIDINGLVPGYYSYIDKNDSKKNLNASFAWKEGFVNVEQSGQSYQLALAAGIQDMLSARYQFMFISYKKSVSTLNGVTLQQRDYQLVGEEYIATKMGNLNCLHLQTKIVDMQYDIWLALDYQKLPVKFKLTNQDGLIVTEDVISSIATVNKK